MATTIDDFSFHINKEAARIESLHQTLAGVDSRLGLSSADPVGSALAASLRAEIAFAENELREQVKIWMGRKR